jgi:hypothetical protein
VKKDVYEQVFRTPEYFLYDPDADRLEGWRLSGAYQPIELNERGWLWSERLGGWIGRWQGAYLGQPATWARIFDEHGEPWPTYVEQSRSAAETEIASLREQLKGLKP